MTTPAIYQAGHLKHRADTLEVAIRTMFPEDDERLARMAWLISGPRFGARHGTTGEVADWDDLYTPPAPPSE